MALPILAKTLPNLRCGLVRSQQFRERRLGWRSGTDRPTPPRLRRGLRSSAVGSARSQAPGGSESLSVRFPPHDGITD